MERFLRAMDSGIPRKIGFVRDQEAKIEEKRGK